MFKKDLKIAVVGDLMLDRFVYGSVDRISPEAPVPVFKTNGKIIETLGGAGNVVNNLVSLGYKPDVISVLGQDEICETIIGKMLGLGVPIGSGIQSVKGRQTSLKVRYVSGGHHLIRVDTETVKPVKYTKSIKKDYDIAIISDYGKGVVTPELMAEIAKHSKTAIVDPCPYNGIYDSLYPANTSLITPNFKEAEMMTGIKASKDSLDQITKMLRALGMKSFTGSWFTDVIITDGDNGMWVFDHDDVTRIPAEKIEVYDVSGAGDTVISVLALAIGSGMELIEAAKLANKAAGIVVGKSGTATVTIEELKQRQ